MSDTTDAWIERDRVDATREAIPVLDHEREL